MANIKDIHLPAETKLTVTCDAVTTATIWQIGDDGKTTGSLTSVAASASGVVGPFSDDRDYRITSSGGDATITQTDQKFDTPLTALTDATITASDVISFEDASDSNNLKRDTIQGILDLAGGGGAWTLISTVTASASASVEFTDLSSTYIQYVVVIDSMVPATDGTSLRMTMSTDNGSTYLSSAYRYSNMRLEDNDTALVVETDATDPDIYVAGALGNDTGESLQAVVRIFNPSQTAGRHMIYYQTAFTTFGGQMANYSGVGCNDTATAIDAIKFAQNSGNITSGTFRLYGLSAS